MAPGDPRHDAECEQGVANQPRQLDKRTLEARRLLR